MNRLLILLAALLVIENTYAQPGNKNDIISLLSTEQKFIRAAVDSSICIIEQEYVLTDSAGKEFGRNNNSFFGKSYSLGIISDSGVLAPADVLHPWKEDKSFDRLKIKPGLTPKLSKIFFKRITDKGFIELKDAHKAIVKDNDIVCFPLPGSLRAINTVQKSTDSTGWLILVSSKQGPDPDTESPYSFYVFRPRITIRDSPLKLYIKNIAVPQKEDILGGAYFTSQVSIGSILFSLAGILNKDTSGWFIKIFSDQPTPPPVEKKDLLTPINDSGKSASVKHNKK